MRVVLNKRGAPRQCTRRQYVTFDSAFERGIDTRLWPETAYPWIEDAQGVGQQWVINEEQQFYVTRKERIPYDDYQPAFVNEAGNLVLRCQPTPNAYQSLACGVLDQYTIVSVNAKSNRITVAGQPWSDPYTGERYVGINRYLRSPLNRTGQGYLCIGDSTKRLMYLRIHESTADVIDTRGATTTHTFELIEELPCVEAIQPGITTITLLRHLPYASGALSARGAFSQAYGSWHIRMRVPKGRGTLAGFSLWPSYTQAHAHLLPLEERFLGVNVFEQPGHGTVQYHSLYAPSVIERNLCSASVLPEAYVRPSVNDVLAAHHTVDIAPLHPHGIDARTQWIEVIWDWYPDNTCAWFVKQEDQFLEAGRSSMPTRSDGSPIPCTMVLKNAFDSWFNRQCEQEDSKGRRPIDFISDPPWDFEVDFVRAYQWEGLPPFMGELPARVDDIQSLAAQCHQRQRITPIHVAA